MVLPSFTPVRTDTDPAHSHKSNRVHSSKCCGSASGIGAFFTPGSGIGFSRISDPGTQTHIMRAWIGSILFLYLFINEIIVTFVIFVATKKVDQLIFPPPLLLLLLDPGWMKIRIRDPGWISRIRNTGSQFISTDRLKQLSYLFFPGEFSSLLGFGMMQL